MGDKVMADMNVRQWQMNQLEPFRQAVAEVTSEEPVELQQHIGQLQSIVALLLENRTQQALMAWNSLHLKPVLRDLRMGPGGEYLVLAPAQGELVTLRMDEVIEDLQRMLDKRAMDPV
jgi:hypothetical protein